MEENKRPWGEYEVLLDEPYTRVKEIRVNPKARLSLQSHDHREEHWAIVQGIGIVVVDNIIKKVHPGDYIFIPKKSIHRIENIDDKTVLKFIEVQLGDSFDENDIIRYQDDYNRVGPSKEGGAGFILSDGVDPRKLSDPSLEGI